MSEFVSFVVFAWKRKRVTKMWTSIKPILVTKRRNNLLQWIGVYYLNYGSELLSVVLLLPLSIIGFSIFFFDFFLKLNSPFFPSWIRVWAQGFTLVRVLSINLFLSYLQSFYTYKRWRDGVCPLTHVSHLSYKVILLMVHKITTWIFTSAICTYGTIFRSISI